MRILLEISFYSSEKKTKQKYEVRKPQFSFQGHFDLIKESLRHDSVAMQEKSIKILVSTAAVFSFRIFLTDATQAYLQSKEKRKQNIHIKAHAEFGLTSNQMLKFIKPSCALAESRVYWRIIVRKNISKTKHAH